MGERRKGKLVVREGKKKNIIVEIWEEGKNNPHRPQNFPLKLEYNEKICEFQLNKTGQVETIWVEGQEITPSQKSSSKNDRKTSITLDILEYEQAKFTIEQDSKTELRMINPSFHLLQNQKYIDNFYLKLHKLPLLEVKTNKRGEKEQKFIFYKNWTWQDSDDRKKKQEYTLQIKPGFSRIKSDFNTWKDRYHQTLSSLKDTGYQIISLPPFSPDWRLIVGLGHPSVYEVSMTLHHTYGFPYIPGSAIKGITRSYVIQEYFDGKEGAKKDEVGALQDEGFRAVFGNPKIKANGKEIKEHKGLISFFDAYPDTISDDMIQIDVMNPHYGPYYSDGNAKTPPADYHNPVPIPFLTVQNTSFTFHLGIKKRADQEILETAKKWLQEALEEHGIGAKTAIGYGYMSEGK